MKPISDIFYITYGSKLDLNKCAICDKYEGVNFVNRSNKNCGIAAKILELKNMKPFEAGLITVAMGGSILASFVQQKPFYTGQNVKVLKPKRDMTIAQKIYYCLCIEANKYKFSTFGREANYSFNKLLVPDTDDLPEWINAYSTSELIINTKIERKELPIDSSDWQYFRIGTLFAIQNCKCANAGNLIDGNDIYYVGAKKNDNGIMKKVAYDNDLVTKGNCMVFICDGQGSVGYSNYMDIDFIGSTTLSVGYHAKLNKYTGLFLTAVLDLERPKYSYGRKYRKFLPETKIKLPADQNGEPDWQYMENYIKSLPYSDKI
jgi:hypothetical protein